MFRIGNYHCWTGYLEKLSRSEAGVLRLEKRGMFKRVGFFDADIHV
jgi:hypothetical protein